MYWCTSARAQVHSVMLVRLTERAAVCPHLHYRCHVNIWWGLNLVFRGYWTVMDMVLHSERVVYASWAPRSQWKNPSTWIRTFLKYVDSWVVMNIWTEFMLQWIFALPQVPVTLIWLRCCHRCFISLQHFFFSLQSFKRPFCFSQVHFFDFLFCPEHLSTFWVRPYFS